MEKSQDKSDYKHSGIIHTITRLFFPSKEVGNSIFEAFRLFVVAVTSIISLGMLPLVALKRYHNEHDMFYLAGGKKGWSPSLLTVAASALTLGITTLLTIYEYRQNQREG
ncbi:MAG: hypothetical protein V4490_08650 [Pseudomonadota bacterium]